MRTYIVEVRVVEGRRAHWKVVLEATRAFGPGQAKRKAESTGALANVFGRVRAREVH